MNTSQLRLGEFNFLIEKDRSAEPINGVAVWVLFHEEPCCDDNGHQYRFFLPLGVKDETIKDVCEAFTLATHCNTLEVAA